MIKKSKTLLFVCMWLGMLLLGAAVYLPGLPGAFVFDDIGSILQNPSILLRTLSLDSLVDALLSGPIGDRPLSTLTFAVDAYYFGLSPAAFKFTNILIHVSCGALLWLLCRELLRAYVRTTGHDLNKNTIGWLSVAVTGIWLVHPLNLTSVLYAVQRETSLAAFFMIAAMLAYTVGRRREQETSRGYGLIWILTPLLVAVGLLCKETAALVPVYLLVIEVTLLRFQGEKGRVSKSALWFYISFLLLPALAAGTLIAIRPQYLVGGYALRDFTLYERLLTECRVVIDYLRWILIPNLRELALFHDDIAVSTGLLQPVTTLLCLFAIAGLLLAAILLRRRTPLLSFGILWFFAGQLLESTFLPLELAFEHRNYLPMFGIVFGTTTSIVLVARHHGKLRLAWAIVPLVIALLASATAIRSLQWHDELSYATTEVAHHPQSPRALAELGWAYITYVVTTKDASLAPRAVEIEERSKEADRNSVNQNTGLAYMFIQLHDVPKARSYLQAAAQDMKSATSSSTLQYSLQSLLTLDVPENRELFSDIDAIFAAATLNQDLGRDNCYMASIWNTYSRFQEDVGDFLRALSSMHSAVSLCPNDPQMRANFASMLLRYGDRKDAKVQIDALRSLHSIRYQSLLHALEVRWEKQNHA